MRELIYKKLEYLKERYSGFDGRKSMRWQSMKFQEKYMNQIDFTELSDEDLVEVFTRIVGQCAKGFG